MEYQFSGKEMPRRFLYFCRVGLRVLAIGHVQITGATKGGWKCWCYSTKHQLLSRLYFDSCTSCMIDVAFKTAKFQCLILPIIINHAFKINTCNRVFDCQLVFSLDFFIIQDLNTSNRLFRNVAGEVKWLQTRLLFAILSPNAFLGKRSNIAVSLDLTRRVRIHTTRACTRITYCIYVMIYVYTCCKSALHSHVLPLANTVGNVRRKFLSLNGMFLHNQINDKWNIKHLLEMHEYMTYSLGQSSE